MRLDKLHFWAIISVSAAVFAFAQAVSGAEISRHTRPDTGIRAAMDWCTAKGGQLSWVEKAPYVLSEDGATATLTGNVLVFTCKTATASTPSWLITWNPPTTRENGQALAVNQIAGYQITINGKTEMVTGTSYTATLPRGTVIQLRTVDTSTPALVSAPGSVTL